MTSGGGDNANNDDDDDDSDVDDDDDGNVGIRLVGGGSSGKFISPVSLRAYP